MRMDCSENRLTGPAKGRSDELTKDRSIKIESSWSAFTQSDIYPDPNPIVQYEIKSSRAFLQFPFHQNQFAREAILRESELSIPRREQNLGEEDSF